MKKVVAVVVALLVLVVGYLVLGSNVLATEFTLIIKNESAQSFEGSVHYLDQTVELPALEAKSEMVYPINLRQLKMNTAQKDQVGSLDMQYRLNNGEQKQIQIWGYIERADTFLYGKTATVTIDQTGRATITFDFENAE